MTLNVYICETFKLCHVVKHVGHFGGIVPSLACILTKQHAVHGGKIPLENPWKWRFRDSKFQNAPRCLGPQELVPLVQVPKPPTIHCQPALLKLFDIPASMLHVIHIHSINSTKACQCFASHSQEQADKLV